MAENIFGRDVKLRFYQNNVPVTVKAKSITVEQVAEEVNDGVNGDDRDELQTITNYFRITIEAYKESATVLTALLASTKNDDAGITQLNKGVGLSFFYHDGTKAAFIMKEVTLDAWSLNVGGRTDRVMQTVKARARYFDKAGATI
jgi:hypothetical protein